MTDAQGQTQNRVDTNTLADWSLSIGEVVAPFGLLGECKARIDTDFPERFSRLKQVCLRDARGNARLMNILGARLHKTQILLKFEGVTTIDIAETLRNHVVQVRARDAVRLPRDEFYIHDLVGCEVVTRSGRVLGAITNVLRSGANDVYAIGTGKDEILLPAIKDVVREVDLTRRRIIVTPTPGLLPDESAEVVEANEVETEEIEFSPAASHEIAAEQGETEIT